MVLLVIPAVRGREIRDPCSSQVCGKVATCLHCRRGTLCPQLFWEIGVQSKGRCQAVASLHFYFWGEIEPGRQAWMFHFVLLFSKKKKQTKKPTTWFSFVEMRLFPSQVFYNSGKQNTEMPHPKPFFFLLYLDGNVVSVCFDILITQGAIDTDSHASWEWGNCIFHSPFLAVK